MNHVVFCSSYTSAAWARATQTELHIAKLDVQNAVDAIYLRITQYAASCMQLQAYDEPTSIERAAGSGISPARMTSHLSSNIEAGARGALPAPTFSSGRPNIGRSPCGTELHWTKRLGCVVGRRTSRSHDVGRRPPTPRHFSGPAARKVGGGEAPLRRGGVKHRRTMQNSMRCSLWRASFGHRTCPRNIRILASTMHRQNGRKLHLKRLESAQGAFIALCRLLTNKNIQPLIRLRAM